MHEIRPLNEAEFRDNVILHEQAYTANAAEKEEDIKQLVEREKSLLQETNSVVPYGAFEQNQLIGSMKLFDFQMNVFGTFLQVGGLSSVAVDLLHKKERVAKSLVDYFLDHYDKRGYALTTLYAFRPDFYYQMGFGYGKKKDVYTIAPHAFPNFNHKNDITYLTPDDKDHLVTCYNRFAEQHHGVMKKEAFQYKRPFEQFDIKIVGVKQNEVITGYAIFSFKKREVNNFLSSNITIHEFVYTNRDALQQLSTFFHTQKDQVNRISVPTQDDTLHHFFTDARDGSDNLVNFVYHQTNTSGLGLMYRIINVERFFNQLKQHNFNNANHTVTFQGTDSMYPANAGDVTVAFTNGKPAVIQGAKADTTIKIDISDLTSLLLGVIDFQKLYLYGKVELSNDNHVDIIDDIFRTRHQPISMTNF
ncbi:enhanced intracellular survival protein Eis [Alkalibacillus sp. S2W]|uniref:GNAT family N-acetyltransferase n=1 Tax=Alkalibacillus sp. S2W TaxID=3386553 RepID=UPI00398CB23C